MRRFGFSLVAVSLCLAGTVCCVGCGTPSLLITPVSNTSELQEMQVQASKGPMAPKVAIIEVEGMLVNAKMGGFLEPTENKVSLFVQQLNEAAADPAVKAVVLRMNSPGGTVTASDTMYQELLRFRQKTHKPVVASAQEVCASGAYYLSCGADKIVCQPTSVVGSIGVIFESLDLTDAAGKLGIHEVTVKDKWGILKDMGSPLHHVRPEEQAVMQEMVDVYFDRFESIVQTNRPVPNLEHVSTGRVFTGQQAVDLGLADQVGLLEDAIELAKQMAHISDASVIMYKRPYGYGGSIYASTQVPQPQANVLRLPIPESSTFLPTGFYYLWTGQ